LRRFAVRNATRGSSAFAVLSVEIQDRFGETAFACVVSEGWLMLEAGSWKREAESLYSKLPEMMIHVPIDQHAPLFS
jgi:hypothetical protein